MELDFHYDGMCPWAYQASKWMRDVRDQLGLTVNWRFFSLEEINRVDGKKHPWERECSYGWSLMRIGALLGNASEEKERALSAYGLALGLAFQMKDDLLDFTASEKSLGKPVGLDLTDVVKLIKASPLPLAWKQSWQQMSWVTQFDLLRPFLLGIVLLLALVLHGRLTKHRSD